VTEPANRAALPAAAVSALRLEAAWSPLVVLAELRWLAA
jgi:hypothetical protein